MRDEDGMYIIPSQFIPHDSLSNCLTSRRLWTGTRNCPTSDRRLQCILVPLGRTQKSGPQCVPPPLPLSAPHSFIVHLSVRVGTTRPWRTRRPCSCARGQAAVLRHGTSGRRPLSMRPRRFQLYDKVCTLALVRERLSCV